MSGRGRGRGRGGRGGFGGPRGGGGGGGLGGFNSDIDYATMVAFNKAEKEKALFPVSSFFSCFRLYILLLRSYVKLSVFSCKADGNNQHI